MGESEKKKSGKKLKRDTLKTGRPETSEREPRKKEGKNLKRAPEKRVPK